MARTLTRAVQNYPAGTYGPFRVDGFTRDDARAIRLRLTFENLTASPVLVGSISLKWDIEDDARVQPLSRPSDTTVDKGGALNPSVSYTFGIPRVAGQRKAVTGGDVTFTLTQTVRCALTVEAV